jgi:hypothetical protein
LNYIHFRHTVLVVMCIILFYLIEWMALNIIERWVYDELFWSFQFEVSSNTFYFIDNVPCILFLSSNVKRLRGRRGRDGSWIYNCLCNQCLSPLMVWVRISNRASVQHYVIKFVMFYRKWGHIFDTLMKTYVTSWMFQNRKIEFLDKVASVDIDIN